MPTKKLVLNSKTNMFGTNLKLSTRDGSHKFSVGNNISYDPTKKLSKKLETGYLFRSPKLDPTDLSEIWDTVEGFAGAASLTAEIDTKSNEVTAYMRIAEKGDAGMFAYTHSLFEKWSDEKTAEAKKDKKKAPKLVVNKDGTVKVRVQVESLGN